MPSSQPTDRTDRESATALDRSAGWRSGALVVMALVVAALIPGCLNVALRDTPGPSAPYGYEESFAEFLDVPYPATMTLEKGDTFTYTRRGVLAGVVTLVGKMTVEELGAYYDEHLPPHGWSPLSEAQNVKLVSTWTRGDKTLTIIATPIVMAIGGNLRVELWVAAPHTRADLGNRAVYRRTDEPSDPVLRTGPVRGGGGGGFGEEDI